MFPETSSSPAPGGGTYNPTWDMSNPQYWTYPEKVISWAFDSATALWDYNQGKDVQAFAYATGNAAYPPTSDFCTANNHCDISVLDTSSAEASSDPCQLTGAYQDHCWWHWPVTWAGTCTTASANFCGTSVLSYAVGAADPGNPVIASEFAPDCTRGNLPFNAVIVGTDEAAMGCPGQNWTSAGPMTWNFAAASNGTYPSKIDFDQIGAGLVGTSGSATPSPTTRAPPIRPTPPAPLRLQATPNWRLPEPGRCQRRRQAGPTSLSTCPATAPGIRRPIIRSTLVAARLSSTGSSTRPRSRTRGSAWGCST